MNREWVDTVAEVLYNRQLMPDELPWHLNSDLDREEPREDATAVLSAVLPLIADAIEADVTESNYLSGDYCSDYGVGWDQGMLFAANIVRGTS